MCANRTTTGDTSAGILIPEIGKKIFFEIEFQNIAAPHGLEPVSKVTAHPAVLQRQRKQMVLNGCGGVQRNRREGSYAERNEPFNEAPAIRHYRLILANGRSRDHRAFFEARRNSYGSVAAKPKFNVPALPSVGFFHVREGLAALGVF